MTYTTDQVVQMAREVGAFMEVLFAGRHDNVVLTESELTTLCNKVERDTLLKAADEFQSAMYPIQTNTSIVITLRRMAGE